MDDSLLKAITQISGSVAGGVVGGFAGFIASIVQERAVGRAKTRNIASALIGEIGALTQLFRDEYLGQLTNLSSKMDATLGRDNYGGRSATIRMAGMRHRRVAPIPLSQASIAQQ